MARPGGWVGRVKSLTFGSILRGCLHLAQDMQAIEVFPC
jgi:hypothetical protein